MDNHTVLPVNTESRLIISRADVLHSWAIPCFSLKVDAIPGRLNIINFFRQVLGLFYGQCREICGANHSFIPICVEVTRISQFKS